MQLCLLSTLLGSLLFSGSVLAIPSPEQCANPNAIGTTCSPAVEALACGISANIADQKNEVAAVSSLGFLLTENPVNTTLFALGQASLLGFVQEGIAIRQNNQKIAPAGNAAIAGLAIVAAAQAEELNLTVSLGMGGVDVQRDSATVETLKTDFNGGIEQNLKNLAAATTGCTIAAASQSSEYCVSCHAVERK